MKETKVFCVGFAKTGTTTLKKTLKSLGYRVAGYDEFRHFSKQQHVTFEELAVHGLAAMDRFDACQDSPWPILYKELDAAFPGSKFIHVIRDRDAWIKSAVGDFSGHPNPMREVIYGTLSPEGNEASWLERYDQHNREVEEYFAGRGDCYLQVKLEELEFETVCEFLGEKYSGQKLPVANTRLKKSLKKILWKIKGRD